MDINRRTAYEALLETEVKKAYSNIAVGRAVEKFHPEDEAFVRSLVYGVLENRISIDYKLSQLVKQKLNKLRPQVLVLLRMGACQLDYMEVPAYAAIDETVKLAKKYVRGLDGFVNGVLRSWERKSGAFEMPDRRSDLAGWLSVKYSYTRDIADIWIRMFGEDGAESLMAAGNAAPPLTIRVNRLKTSPAALTESLKNQGFETAMLDESMYSMNVRGTGLLSTKDFRTGMFSVQDYSSIMAVNALAPAPGDRILDICAAPGGKSHCAAELMENKGTIISCDIHPHKLELISKTADKLGISIIKTMENDACLYRKEWEQGFDRVIVDAPCSGLGVVRRKPEIKLHTTAEDIKNLAAIQLKILETAAAYVKKNGYLMYSTCTITDVENQHVLDLFLQKNKIFLKKIEKQLLPDYDISDGFYFCVLQRF